MDSRFSVTATRLFDDKSIFVREVNTFSLLRKLNSGHSSWVIFAILLGGTNPVTSSDRTILLTEQKIL